MDGGQGFQQVLSDFYHSLSPANKTIFDEISNGSSASSPAPSMSSTETVSPDQESRPSVMQVSGVVPRGGSRGRMRQVRPENYRRRPLNAFMAFRSYYSAELAGLTQKVKSGIMRRMWAAEPRKNIFVLLARAYTEVRDNHHGEVNLEKFLAAVVNESGVIPAKDYLEKMGWRVETDGGGDSTLTRSEFFDADASLQEYPNHTNMSVSDLVNMCYAAGLLSHSSRLVTERQQQTNVMTLRLGSASPAANSAPVRRANGANAIFDLDAELNQVMLNSLAIPTMPESEFDFNAPMVQANYHPSIDEVNEDQQQAYERTPFDMHFHPSVQPPVLGFDPNLIQDNFDPFNLSIEDIVKLSE